MPEILDENGHNAAQRAFLYRAASRGMKKQPRIDLPAIAKALMEEAMPTNVLKKRSDTEWTIPSEALRSRIDRHLRKLVPYREFIYDRSTGGFYVRIVSTDAQHMTRQGPYYYKDMSGLARMLNLFHLRNGLDLPPVTNIDRRGNEYPETVLPSHLKFEVISLAYAEMARQLTEAGHTVILKGSKTDIPVQPVKHEITAPVTASDAITGSRIEEPNPGLDEYVELTEEQERALSGLDPGR